MLKMLIKHFPLRMLMAPVFSLQIAVPVILEVRVLPEAAAALWLVLGMLCIYLLLPKEVVRACMSLPIPRREMGRVLLLARVACMAVPGIFVFAAYTGVFPLLIPKEIAAWQMQWFLVLLTLTLCGLVVGPFVIILVCSPEGRNRMSLIPSPNPVARRWVFRLVIFFPGIVLAIHGIIYYKGLPHISVLYLYLPLLVLAAPISVYCLVANFRRPERIIAKWMTHRERVHEAIMEAGKSNGENAHHEGWRDCDYFLPGRIRLATVWRNEKLGVVMFTMACAAFATGSLLITPGHDAGVSMMLFMAIFLAAVTLMGRTHSFLQSLRALRSLPLTPRQLTLRYLILPTMTLVDLLPFVLFGLLWGGQTPKPDIFTLCLLSVIPGVVICSVLGTLLSDVAMVIGFAVMLGVGGILVGLLPGYLWVLLVVMAPLAVWSLHVAISRSSRAYRPRRTLGEG